MSFHDDCTDVAEPSATAILAHALALDLRDLIDHAELLARQCDAGQLPDNGDATVLGLRVLKVQRALTTDARCRALMTEGRTAAEDREANAAMAGYGDKVEETQRRTA